MCPVTLDVICGCVEGVDVFRAAPGEKNPGAAYIGAYGVRAGVAFSDLKMKPFFKVVQDAERRIA